MSKHSYHLKELSLLKGGRPNLLTRFANVCYCFLYPLRSYNSSAFSYGTISLFDFRAPCGVELYHSINIMKGADYENVQGNVLIHHTDSSAAWRECQSSTRSVNVPRQWAIWVIQILRRWNNVLIKHKRCMFMIDSNFFHMKCTSNHNSQLMGRWRKRDSVATHHYTYVIWQTANLTAKYSWQYLFI